VHDKVALAFNQNRHRDRLELAIVLKRLQLVELKCPVHAASLPTPIELSMVKVSANFSHSDEPPLDGLAIH
jgi:hypothetical protein